MNTLLERPLLALAWATAVILLALGLRRIRTSGRSGLFLTAMSLFMAFQGADVPDAAAKDPKKITGKKTHVPIPPELQKGETWAKFKDLWQRLDAVAPGQEPDAITVGDPTYSMTLKPKQQEALRKELAGILGIDPGQLFRVRFTGPPQKKGIAAPGEHLSTLGQALAVITMKRIDHMGVDPTMMMRMVPPPTLYFRGSVVERIERRIDSLIALRAKNAVTTQELDIALQKLQDDVWLHSILAVFDDHRLGHIGPVMTPSLELTDPHSVGSPGQEGYDADVWIRGFEAACAPRKARPPEQQQQAATPSAAQGDDEVLREACRRARERLAMLEGIRGDLAALIADLETR